MADAVKETPEVLIGGHVSGDAAFGAYSPATSYAREVQKTVPYSMLEKTGRLGASDAEGKAQEVSDALFARLTKKPETTAVFDANNRWLKELGITSTSQLDFQKAWETDNFRRQKSEHEWRDTYGGKLAIRTFSRGVMGSVFFAAGQHLANTEKFGLKNYAYDPTDPSKNSKLDTPLAYVARLFDKTLGAGIYKMALVAHDGDKAKAKNVVTFRHNNQWSAYGGAVGRSYGHEGLAITFDFGLASLGDYMGREIAGLIDPNTEKKWMKDGHVDMPAASKALLKSVWSGVTKSMGEDYFAMAAGYPYMVRGTRNLINKFSPGFSEDSDRFANGGSFKVDDHNKIVGNFQLEGMADLGLRFTAYNVLTKIFRDGYDKAANNFKHFWDGDRKLHMPHLDVAPTPKNLAKMAVDGVKSAAQYLTRTVIKVSIIMIPSSSVFAFIRAAQSKDIGLAINTARSEVVGASEGAIKGAVGVFVEKDGKKEWQPVFTDGNSGFGGRRSEAPITAATQFFHRDGSKAQFNEFVEHKGQRLVQRFDPYAVVTPTTEWHDKFTNPVGRFCHEAGHTLTEVVKPVARFFGGKDVNVGRISKHAQRYMDATLAYTPYFMAKTDLLSTAYDTPRMDMSVDRMLHGASHLQFGEFKAGAGEVLHTILARPFTDPDRESLAQKKMRTYSNQLWSNQDEIIAKEREQEYQDRMDAMLSLGKPIAMGELYRQSFADRLGRKPKPMMEASNDSYYSQNITPITPKKPEDYKKPEEQQEWKQQANASWGQRAVREYNSATTSQGQTIN